MGKKLIGEMVLEPDEDDHFHAEARAFQSRFIEGPLKVADEIEALLKKKPLASHFSRDIKRGNKTSQAESKMADLEGRLLSVRADIERLGQKAVNLFQDIRSSQTEHEK